MPAPGSAFLAGESSPPPLSLQPRKHLNGLFNCLPCGHPAACQNANADAVLFALQQVLVVLVVVFAHIFLDLPFRMQPHAAALLPGSRKNVGIINGGLVVKFLVGDAMVALDNVIVRRVLVGADESLVVETHHVNHQSIPVPVSYRIAHVRWVKVVRVSAAISRDDEEDM